MNDKMVMELYSEDISRIKLPPISDKVLRAVREKKEIEKRPSDKPEHHTAPSKAHRKIPIKYIFAAMLTLLVASVPIIVILTNDASVSVAPEGSSNVSTVKEESDNPSAAANALERIKEQQIYGAVSLSGKTEKELDELLLTYNGDSKVYEDDSYIYSFDSSGNLIELVNKTPVDENGAAVSEEETKDNAKSFLNVFFADWNNYSYDTEITNMNNAIPAWRIVFSKKVQGLLQKKITMTFDKSGNIRRIVLSGTGNDVGIISKSEAIQIALNEIQSGKYLLPDFNTKDVDIIVETEYKDNQPYYLVSIDDISIDKYVEIIIDIQINPKTGQIMQIDY